ncbi:MAG TPA: hypothetical protein VI759_03555 [Dehalococcoidia bacterium]|nr:hypothetical protein [Dehalococcoidia bacterium]
MRLQIVLIGVVLGLAALAGLWVYACTGPRVRVESVTLEAPSAPDHPYRVNVILHNEARHEGEVIVSVRLKGKDGGVYPGRENVEVHGEERLTVAVEVFAPRGDYEASAEVTYPPQ